MKSVISTGPWTWPRLKASLREWAIILIGLIAAQGLSALALIVVARRTPPTEFGQYLATYGLVSLLVVLPAFGLDGWLLARGATHPAPIQILWWSALRVRVYLLVMWLLVLWALTKVLPPDTFPPLLLLVSAIGLAAESLAALAYAALRNLRRNKWVAIFQAAGAITLFCGALALPFEKGQITWFALFRTGVSLALAISVVGWMSQNQNHAAEILPFRGVLRAARAFMLADVAVAIYLRADLTIVSFILGSSGASVYGPALNLINMCFLVPNALYFLVVPTLAQARHLSLEVFDRLGKIQLVAQLVSGLFLTVIVFVLAGPLVYAIYGSNYMPSAAVLGLLSPLLTIKSLNFGLGALLTTAGLQARRTTVQVLVAIFNGCANVVAVRIWGVMGAAAVYILSEVLLLTGYLLIFCRWRRSLVPQVATLV